ncbi:flagellar export chaperone FliS [Paeniglutamicibacter antarcticus]|uniref:Flagellar export chaperone FliS n=1 Tax=Arthrobacter terrae TaxID=2935737 RepID=A0A931CQ21_9MICC|nr:flagellar export chaperone FliS [Arthrobacter terrae]MBG0740285.1 flagellar export chaperone FliS [Arthrobacter terrae]
MSTAYAQQMAKYNREAVLSAPPARLLTMLYDRLLLDLGRAEVAQQEQNWAAASENLVHAQAIIAELSASLNTEAWDGADQLVALYTFASNTMIEANIRRDAAKTRDCITVLEPLRQSWHEAAASLPVQMAAAPSSGGNLGIG